MREKTIERKLTLMVKKRGGICPKFVSPGFDGMPDRIVLLPGCHFAFVEVKAPGEKPPPTSAFAAQITAQTWFSGICPGCRGANRRYP